MSVTNIDNSVSSFIEALRHTSAVRILELGTKDTSFLLKVINEADWAGEVELHCAAPQAERFDEELISAAEGTETKFKLIKHDGSESEVSDAVMELAEREPFDAAFISSATSQEALLTAFMVCHESIKSGGVLGVAEELIEVADMSLAISSFREMFSDAYNESDCHIFVKV